MNALLQDPVSMLVFRLALVLLFAAAGLHKLRRFAEFRDTVADYELVPAALVTPAALLVVAAELIVVVTLLVREWIVFGSVAASTLLVGYAIAIGINLVRGRDSIDCGCGGSALRRPISGWLVLRNLLLAGAARAAGTGSADRALGAWDYGLAVVTLLALVMLYQATEQLLANQPRLRRLVSAHD